MGSVALLNESGPEGSSSKQGLLMLVDHGVELKFKVNGSLDCMSGVGCLCHFLKMGLIIKSTAEKIAKLEKRKEAVEKARKELKKKQEESLGTMATHAEDLVRYGRELERINKKLEKLRKK